MAGGEACVVVFDAAAGLDVEDGDFDEGAGDIGCELLSDLSWTGTQQIVYLEIERVAELLEFLELWSGLALEPVLDGIAGKMDVSCTFSDASGAETSGNCIAELIRPGGNYHLFCFCW